MELVRSPVLGLPVVVGEPATDPRGYFCRLFDATFFESKGLPADFRQVSLSHNLGARTLRGMHFQRHPESEDKLVRCVRGRIWDVAVDLRPTSPTFRRWESFDLTERNGMSVVIPKGFAHGFMTLEPDSSVLYQITPDYAPASAAGFRWDDPAVAIDWPHEPSVMSDRDAALPLLEEIDPGWLQPATERGTQHAV